MRISRLVAGAVTAGLVGVVPLAVSAPASAAPATITLTTSTPAVVYKDSLSFSGNITGPNGGFITSGTASLQVFTAAAPVWTTIQTDTSASSYFFSGVVAGSNAQYRVAYSGGSSGSSSAPVAADPGTSAPVAVAVQRKVKAKTKGLSVIAKVTPDYGKKKVQILVKKGKKFKKFKTFKTDKKGQFTFRAPKRNGFRFVVSIPGDATFAAVYNPYRVRVF